MTACGAVNRKVPPIERKHRVDPFAGRQVHQAGIGQVELVIGVAGANGLDVRVVARMQVQEADVRAIAKIKQPFDAGGNVPQQPGRFGQYGPAGECGAADVLQLVLARAAEGILGSKQGHQRPGINEDSADRQARQTLPCASDAS